MKELQKHKTKKAKKQPQVLGKALLESVDNYKWTT